MHKKDILCLIMFIILKGFPGGTVVNHPPTNAGDTRDMGREDTLKKDMATHSRSLAWKRQGTWWAPVHGVEKSQTWSTMPHT